MISIRHMFTIVNYRAEKLIQAARPRIELSFFSYEKRGWVKEEKNIRVNLSKWGDLKGRIDIRRQIR